MDVWIESMNFIRRGGFEGFEIVERFLRREADRSDKGMYRKKPLEVCVTRGSSSVAYALYEHRECPNPSAISHDFPNASNRSGRSDHVQKSE